VLELAADYPSPDVCVAALQRLAFRALQSKALARAATDRVAHIRRWATRNRTMAVAHGDALRHDHTDLQEVAEKPDLARVRPSLFPGAGSEAGACDPMARRVAVAVPARQADLLSPWTTARRG
jgi:hypothetical protein